MWLGKLEWRWKGDVARRGSSRAGDCGVGLVGVELPERRAGSASKYLSLHEYNFVLNYKS